MNGLFVLAFGAGLLAPVNPCGFAVLPAVLAYGSGAGSGGREGTWARLVGGVRSGVALSVGFTGTFTVVGLLIAAGLRPLIGAIPWLAAVLGAVLVLLGLVLVAGVRVPLGVSRLAAVGKDRKRGGMIAFGAGYALASASCSLALLLAVITQALSGSGWASVLLVFAGYAAGSSVLLVAVAVTGAFAGTIITGRIRRLLPHMSRITGMVLALSGGYLLLYWLPQLAGGAPGTTALSAVAGPLSGWISSHELIVVAAVALIVVSVLVGGALRRTAVHRRNAKDCCDTETTDPSTSQTPLSDTPRSGVAGTRPGRGSNAGQR
ncbi:cytochrome c biogenesis CcdA family protein [Microbacterium testaceum]|uniref:cytochrome c biogenesis CcdA family protein n=1 Tax=Microbacterium testaceum TaxID=2033 RepID=UPI0009BD6935|nr:cytochrome c biogenesis protein CcdA [Microbacterium testaceum]